MHHYQLGRGTGNTANTLTSHLQINRRPDEPPKHRIYPPPQLLTGAEQMDCRIPNTEPELSESLYVVASSEVREVTRVQY